MAFVEVCLKQVYNPVVTDLLILPRPGLCGAMPRSGIVVRDRWIVLLDCVRHDGGQVQKLHADQIGGRPGDVFPAQVPHPGAHRDHIAFDRELQRVPRVGCKRLGRRQERTGAANIDDRNRFLELERAPELSDDFESDASAPITAATRTHRVISTAEVGRYHGPPSIADANATAALPPPRNDVRCARIGASMRDRTTR